MGQSEVNKLTKLASRLVLNDRGAHQRSEAESVLEPQSSEPLCLLTVAVVGKVVTPGVTWASLEHDNRWRQWREVAKG